MAAAREDESLAFGRGYVADIWHFAALSADVRRGALTRRMICGQPMVLGRTAAGALFALRDVCPHRAAPLSAGRLTSSDGGPTLECAYHGWRFAPSGTCVAIPSLASGQELDLAKIRVRAFPVAERQGLAFVWIGRRLDKPDGPPPTFPALADRRPRFVIRTTFEAHIDHAVIGLMDPAHGPYVHQQWWWRSRASAHEKTKAFLPREAGFAMTRHAPSSNSRAYRLLGGAPTTEISFRLPALRWEHVEVGRHGVLALTCLTPADTATTAVTQIVWSDHPLFAAAGPAIRAAAVRFLRQDGDMIRLQNLNRDHAGPFLFVDDADTQAKWYQQLKRAWAAARAEGRAFSNPLEPASLRWVS
ncbi:MAG TPA: aromatic ring-hydroxylating dioxygenase subunit alpha [Caulobacteraceae bacterium]|nr:aromatic ring-hydroxylating dioxygenase subunit alpha [Caulobacteraceae bacterium]